MVKFILPAALLFCNAAFATVNTMDNVDEYDNGNKKVCVYSNGNRTETISVSQASSCPSKRTFH